MKKLRVVVWGLSVALTVGAVVAWAATGARAWTRYPSENIESVQSGSEEGLGDLFAETGLEDESGALEEIDNAYRFGLLPSGPGRGAVSVAGVAGVCALASGVVWWVGRRKRG